MLLSIRAHSVLDSSPRPEAATDLGKADFVNGTSTVHIEGTLTLNTVKVRCVTDTELSSLSGNGHLVVLEEAINR
ncbi:hypothetical protein [Streptomyces sp. NBC_01618]|uniref:hypothetical protein n=1 Tax=Streptomyces sp. NBC_01618 TaxID=2975900 RepID=UPI00386F2445|nr:hypothetical protein OH735_02625 [Streptomyces sp. NBC_01618]